MKYIKQLFMQMIYMLLSLIVIRPNNLSLAHDIHKLLPYLNTVVLGKNSLGSNSCSCRFNRSSENGPNLGICLYIIY